jgi:hypothetical protein
MKGIQRFGIKGKLPSYVKPFPIIKRWGLVAYRLALPPNLSSFHSTFHISQLNKCLRVPTEAVESNSIQIEHDLTYILWTSNQDPWPKELSH